MISDTSADERRTSKRVSWDCLARLLPLSLELQSRVVSMHQVEGRNISEGGLQICSDRLFPLKSRLLVEMESPEIPEGIQAVGSVTWISPTTSENRWCLGIEFSDVGDSALTSIRVLMHQGKRPIERPRTIAAARAL
ncbi:type IV pilus assembly PilZ [Thiorhodococcus drewsii AZ1]|uniref:Type IV pilus assembly PilZ n=1 Tax=Thiorhodococcus drewsii AZ1 TaxID=765913 RepID=G2E0L4_9GAMM|nr:PilZ domain-containing protein [Thiorhodococcus drewsii]EGV31636.1 type IV pilus assembly PilZ [Thiorhodococcus drewsii AZ1]